MQDGKLDRAKACGNDRRAAQSVAQGCDIVRGHGVPARSHSVNVLVTGATGFIGRALVAALAARGHVVHAGSRSAANGVAGARVRAVHVDFGRDVVPAAWHDRLAGIDAVVNAVGILRERGAQTFARLHVEAPIALFDACRARGISRVVQVSALGADADATTAYHRTKRAADTALLERIPSAWVAQPSLVHGPGGASARLFGALASLPVIAVPAQARASLQPIHLDDLVGALCALVEREPRQGGRVALVGPEPVTLRELLLRLRTALALPPAPVVVVPAALVTASAALATVVPGALLDRDTLAMLARGNAADSTPTVELLGHAPRPIEAFVAPRDAPAARALARLAWLLPLLRASIATVWIVTGVVSLWVFPAADSHALLVRTGVPAALAPAALVAAALLDLAFGALVPLLRGEPRRWLWRAQATLIVFYSVVIALRLPEYWIHPYGPLLKNLPILAVLVALDVLEDDPRTRAA